MARQNVSENYRFYFGDVRRTGAWGMPNNAALPKIILRYEFEPLIVDQEPFHVYTVDGKYSIVWPALWFPFCVPAQGGETSKTTVLIHYSDEEIGAGMSTSF